MRTRWSIGSHAAAVGACLVLLSPHLLVPVTSTAPPECTFEGEQEYCFDGICQGAATCVGYKPEVTDNERCLTEFGESGANIVGNLTITLEHHNWLSAEILTEAMAILLQDILGYKLRFLDITGNAGSATRLALGRADVNMEYWEDNNIPELTPIVSKGLIQRQQNNFPGQENLFISSKDPIKDLPIWWDYYRTYSGNTTNEAMEAMPVSERAAGVGGPREHITLDGEVYTAKDITVGCEEGHQIAKDGCDLETMQWYPLNDFCKKDPVTLQTPCREIYGHSMGWSYGKIEGLINAHNIPATFVNWGANFTKVLLDQVERGNKVMHYWWTPDPFIPMVQKQGYTISEIMWPPYKNSCMQEDGCGYESSVISKILGARMFEDELLTPAVDLIKNFIPDLSDVEKMLGYHVDGGGSGTTAREAACQYLKGNTADVLQAIQRRDELAKLCTPGQAAVEGQVGMCRDCPAGTFSDSSASTECTPCPAGTFAKEKSNQCISCPPGHYSAPGSPECLRCAPGTYAETANATCTNCPAGTFAASDASSACKPCPLDQYTVSDGSSTCKACPEFTTTIDLGSTSADACICTPGSYSDLPSLVPGEPADCAPCPSGAVCGGNFTVPVPLPGYWMTSITPELRARRDVIALECSGGACDHTCDTSDEMSTSALSDISELACRSDPDQVCADGYEGRLCFECSSWTHFGLGPECRSCPAQDKEIKTGILIFAVIVIWIVINRVLTSDYNAIDVSLIYLQLVSVVVSFSLPWPTSRVWQSITTIISLTQFDVDFVTPSCFLEVTPMRGYLFQLLFPIIVAALYTAQYHVSRALVRAGVMARLSPLTQLLLSYIGLSSDEEELRSNWDQVVSNSLSMLNVTYLSITVKNLQQFMCQEESEDVRFLSFMPTVECGSNEHKMGMTLAVFGLVFYTFGFPFYFVYILAKGRMQNKLHEARYLARYGFMYMRYESEYWYGELLLILRRLLFSVSLVAFSNDAVWQPATATVSLFVAYGLHTCLQPFYEDRIDFLEKIAMMSLAVLLVCGMLLQAVDGDSGYSQTIEALAILSIVCELAIAGVITYLDEEDVRVRTRFSDLFEDDEQEKEKEKDKENGEVPRQTLLKPSPSMLAKRKKLQRQQTKQPGRFKIMQEPTNIIKKVSRNSSQMFTDLLQRRKEDLEMTRSLTADAIRAYLKLADKAEKMQDNEVHKQLLDRVRDLEDAMADDICDESLTSDYSVHPAAQLYRALLNGEAYFLIDYLLSLPPDSKIVTRWRECMKDLENFFERYINGNEQAKYTTVMENHDLPSILRWALLKSDNKSRENFSVLVDTIFKEMKENPTMRLAVANTIDDNLQEAARILAMRKKTFRPLAKTVLAAKQISDVSTALRGNYGPPSPTHGVQVKPKSTSEEAKSSSVSSLFDKVSNGASYKVSPEEDGKVPVNEGDIHIETPREAW
mmetsp:Transcript_35287/g.42472  ORF Transcript_35287/g.42472 Transcript_35287/m.42472 type:complete len:1440 (+) Transcript_35287:605-4924(+)